MTLRLPLPDGSAPHVLVVEPGPRASETVQSLLDQGARVDVQSPAPDARLVDLAGRRLITLHTEDDLDTGRYDIVLRDPLRAAATATTDRTTGRVVLVGGGPGPLGLLTIAGLEAVRTADVLVCDRLAPLAALEQAKPGAEVVHVGKIPRGEFTPQEQINAILVDRALAGRRVVRLKGGDNFVFGRGGEEWNACVEAGIPVEVVPGVSSSIAVPALAGIPLTHRSLTQGFVVVSGHVTPEDPRSDIDWDALARLGLTIVILMGVAALPQITARLLRAGLDPATPAASIADGGMPSQRLVRGDLATLPAAAAAEDIGAPAVTVIGPAVSALLPQA
ncbi:MAG: uroporphyrinogen-III C-methyltransferase [Phycicoccus sp.]|uniref:uroporphyrinogen-III C-methyltransferase n=1 Tax=Phycicoccus TaxID=367298 RepID=UPI002589DC2C|nr:MULTISPECIES: uroporphyrinogen-III C-methyltransferase [Phycicoccus]MCO5302108.1 uroporphyrinogen-III C-methyltransferase [Phycicoccus sp.]HPF76456.1 uroporphyrinogen-III C-methyltransferase [Phycicoccus elongatus]HPQ73893.1 uroporphyrinogen-III C-methyltransferase [Phycicoccus elongatus]HRV57588.1 uroporphyrinogen-III C-methyltransferase [Phycicoccus sp.]